MQPERFGALPLGELHPEKRCALCGLDSRSPGAHNEKLRQTTLQMTRALCMVCVDIVACQRRRYNARRRIL